MAERNIMKYAILVKTENTWENAEPHDYTSRKKAERQLERWKATQPTMQFKVIATK